MQPHRSLASDESQKICIGHVRVGGHHAGREAGVDVERAMFEQLRPQQ